MIVLFYKEVVLRKFVKCLGLSLSVISFVGFSSFAAAQSASISGAQPTSRTATFGDWLVRCRQIQPQATGKKASTPKFVETCEMVHIIRVARQQNPQQANPAQPPQSEVLAQIAIGKLPGSKGTKIVFQVPGGAWLRSPIEFKLASKQDAFEKNKIPSLFSADYFRCQGIACLADHDLDTKQLTALSKAKFAQMHFQHSPQQTIRVPVSLNGFKSALASITAK